MSRDMVWMSLRAKALSSACVSAAVTVTVVLVSTMAVPMTSPVEASRACPMGTRSAS